MSSRMGRLYRKTAPDCSRINYVVYTDALVYAPCQEKSTRFGIVGSRWLDRPERCGRNWTAMPPAIGNPIGSEALDVVRNSGPLSTFGDGSRRVAAGRSGNSVS